MIFQPVLHPILLALLCAVPAFFVIRALVKGPSRGLWALRLGVIVVVFAMLLRPGIPGGTSQTLATDTDVVIVVDTTASIVAEDWAGDRPRIDGVRADVQAIVDEYPGARFALISFDAAAPLRRPLTTAATALMASLDDAPRGDGSVARFVDRHREPDAGRHPLGGGQGVARTGTHGVLPR